MIYLKKCKFCNTEFETNTNKKVFCNEVCGKQYHDKKAKDKVIEQRKQRPGVEGIDFITCQYCGDRLQQISQSHLDVCNPGKTKTDYKTEFNLESTFCTSVTKNFGLHMKEEKYRNMVSEKVKGELNPNSKARTTEEQRKSRSPFSKGFSKYQDLNEEEKTIKISEFAKDALKDRISDTTIEYYLLKGLTEEEAKQALKNRQTTFSLEKCI